MGCLNDGPNGVLNVSDHAIRQNQQHLHWKDGGKYNYFWIKFKKIINLEFN